MRMIEDVINIKIIGEAFTIMDFMPYIISILSILTRFIIVFIQYRQNKKLHEKNIIYNAKKEVLYDVLSFMDTYVSWLTPLSGIVPIRENTTKSKITSEARLSYNKLCLYCDNDKLLELFWKIINPNSNGKPYDVYSLYNEFRSECRKELGVKKKDLPKENIFLSVVTTLDIENSCKE